MIVNLHPADLLVPFLCSFIESSLITSLRNWILHFSTNSRCFSFNFIKLWLLKKKWRSLTNGYCAILIKNLWCWRVKMESIEILAFSSFWCKKLFLIWFFIKTNKNTLFVASFEVAPYNNSVIWQYLGKFDGKQNQTFLLL